MTVWRQRPRGARGRLHRIRHTSEVLADNPWGDPVARELVVYAPAEAESAQALPVLWDLAPYTKAGPAHAAWRNYGENLPERLDRLIETGAMGPVLLAFPDAYTALGGNQYVNSPALGRYEDYLADELVPLVDEHFSTRASAAGRALFGKSSGGYGAMTLAMRRPDVWSAAASHAGDVGFDWVYVPEFPDTCLALERYGGDIRRFVAAFWDRESPRWTEFHALMVICLAASYDPDPDDPERIRLPFDLETCTLDPQRWDAWLRHDPLQMVDRYTPVLRQLRGLWIDVGRRDQYRIQFGSRRLHRRLEQLAVAHSYEEFDGTHSDIDHRLDLSLPYLYRALSDGQCGSQSDSPADAAL